ncbi:MAG: 2-dehydropantoate 2-reductase [Bacteroidales bacterium]|nr:2-dehydropantoate 2-reductase [Bacteroidales bacterium]
MIYSIIGTGGIGGYFGGCLARAGKEVHFLLHKDYNFVREHGLQVNSCRGDFHLDGVNAYDNSADMPASDVVIVALKSIKNHLLKDLLPPLLKPDTLVLLIENGIGVEAQVQAMFPQALLAAGLAFICTAKTGPGVVHHQDLGKLTIAPYTPGAEQRTAEVIRDLTEAGVKAVTAEYLEARWKKQVWNMPFNGMTVALNTSTDALMANPSTAALIRAQMLEVIAAARALGVKNIDENFADLMLEMTAGMKPYAPSMKLDHDFGRPMEIGAIYTEALRQAREAGCPMPRLEMLEAQLRFIEGR